MHAKLLAGKHTHRPPEREQPHTALILVHKVVFHSGLNLPLGDTCQFGLFFKVYFLGRGQTWATPVEMDLVQAAAQRTVEYIEESFAHLATMKRRVYY
jgi:hypothetical protein